MSRLEEQTVDCPYCGEAIVVLIDCSIPHQEYVEDCQVCCRPIELSVTVETTGGIAVHVSSDSD